MQKKPRWAGRKISYREIYRAIANQSSLNMSQVEECFDTYYKLLLTFSNSKFRNDDICVPLPKIGFFYFLDKKGVKKGSTYIINRNRKGGKLDRIEYTIEKDQPNYKTIKFRVGTKLSKEFRKLTTYEQEENETKD